MKSYGMEKQRQTRKSSQYTAVKAAHLVPKKLESAELSMLFGGDVNLSDPRNGNKVAPHFSD